MSLYANVETYIKGLLDQANGASYPINWGLIANLLSGTGAGQIDRVYDSKGRSLAASGTENLDLAGLQVSDPLNTTISFARIHLLAVKAASTNTNSVNVTRPASNGVPIYLAAGDGEPVTPGDWILKVWGGSGIVVTAGTGDLITFTNSAGGTSVSYDVLILGRSV